MIKRRNITEAIIGGTAIVMFLAAVFLIVFEAGYIISEYTDFDSNILINPPATSEMNYIAVGIVFMFAVLIMIIVIIIFYYISKIVGREILYWVDEYR